MNGESVERVLSRLHDVRRNGSGAVALCPAHDDHRQSLSVDEGDDGRALVHCHAGCEAAAIVAKLGLGTADLFAEKPAGPTVVAEYEYRDATGTLIYVVERRNPKDFRQRRPDGNGGWHWNLKDVTPLPYRLPELRAADAAEPVIVVEGEKDVETLARYGFVATTNSGGAGKWKPELSKHLAGRRVIVLPDNDDAGRAHAAAVAKALAGIASSVRILDLPALPAKADASDFFMAHGSAAADRLRELIASAPEPLADPTPPSRAASLIVPASTLREGIEKLYENGLPRGLATGWESLDRHFRPRFGEFTVISGMPASGKSNFVDALLVNLVFKHGAHVGILSAENLPLERHAVSIIQKIVRKPFSEGPTPRMTVNELRLGRETLEEHFTFIRPDDGLTVDSILEVAELLVTKHHVSVIVLDPWNELDHSRPASMTETEHVSAALSRLRRFARTHGVHLFVIVHPTKLQRRDDGSYPVPTLYDCAGSAAWRNKADNGIVIYRDIAADNDAVEVHVQKIRFAECGRVGMVRLKFDRPTGRYADTETFHSGNSGYSGAGERP
jgi:hypothetical protein